MVTRSTAQLVGHGWLEVQRVRYGNKTRNRYRPLQMVQVADGRAYVVLPLHVLQMVGAGELTGEHLRSLLCWIDACGREGWTTDTLDRFGARYGYTIRTARSHRSALLKGGWLEVEVRPGTGTTTAVPGRLIHPDRTAGSLPKTPAQHPARLSTAPAEYASSPRQNMHHHPGNKCTPEVPPVEVPPDEIPACGPARRAGTDTNAGTSASTSPPAPKSRNTPPASANTALAGDVLAALPTKYLEQPRWVRAHLITTIARALDRGFGPASIVAAVRRHEAPHSNAARVLQRCLAELKADIKAGACPDCAQPPELPKMWTCASCNPDRDELSPAEQQAVEALMARLQDPTDLDTPDTAPDATDLETGQRQQAQHPIPATGRRPEPAPAVGEWSP